MHIDKKEIKKTGAVAIQKKSIRYCSYIIIRIKNSQMNWYVNLWSWKSNPEIIPEHNLKDKWMQNMKEGFESWFRDLGGPDFSNMS